MIIYTPVSLFKAIVSNRIAHSSDHHFAHWSLKLWAYFPGSLGFPHIINHRGIPQICVECGWLPKGYHSRTRQTEAQDKTGRGENRGTAGCRQESVWVLGVLVSTGMEDSCVEVWLSRRWVSHVNVWRVQSPAPLPAFHSSDCRWEGNWDTAPQCHPPQPWGVRTLREPCLSGTLNLGQTEICGWKGFRN